MASIVRDKNRGGQPNGRWSLQYQALDGKRRTVRLGKLNAKQAEAIKVKVEAILAAAVSQTSWEPEVAAWVAKLAAPMHDKLARQGILPARKAVAEKANRATLGAFLDSNLADRKGPVAGSTLLVDEQVKDYLVEKFGRAKLLTDFSEGDADKWRLWLGKPVADDPEQSGKGLAPNTVRKRCAIARRMFKSAVRQRLIDANPFSHVEGGVTVRANKSRDYFVTLEEIKTLLNNAPNDEFKLIIALCRFGALRCPSEVIGLKWSDINWSAELLTVRSPKTAHVEGHEDRVIPLFPELRKRLDKVYFDPESDEEYVLKRYRRPGVNLRTALLRVIRKAQLVPWPKLFQSLRQTRVNELNREYPAHVARAWCGHSKDVAEEFYLRPSQEDIDKALGKKCKQNRKQTAADKGGLEKQPPTETPKKTRANVVVLGNLESYQVVREGLEPPTKGL